MVVIAHIHNHNAIDSLDGKMPYFKPADTNLRNYNRMHAIKMTSIFASLLVWVSRFRFFLVCFVVLYDRTHASHALAHYRCFDVEQL